MKKKTTKKKIDIDRSTPKIKLPKPKTKRARPKKITAKKKRKINSGY